MMKKKLSALMLTAALVATLGATPVLAATTTACPNGTCPYETCTYENCTQTGRHEHDGKTYAKHDGTCGNYAGRGAGNGGGRHCGGAGRHC